MVNKILLVRHGESIANATKVSQGNKDEWIDTSLSEKGKEQAEKVAKRLKTEEIDIIYSSDVKVYLMNTLSIQKTKCKVFLI